MAIIIFCMKVAICISGQLRNYEASADSVIKNLVIPNDADLFIDTWDLCGYTNKLILLLPVGFTELLPIEFHHDISDLDKLKGHISVFENKLPSLYSAIINHQNKDVVTKEKLSFAYSGMPTKINVEFYHPNMFANIESKFSSNRDNVNTISKTMFPMFYKIDSCFRLALEYAYCNKIHYDYIIRMRPDFIIPQKIIFDEILSEDTIYGLLNPMYYEGGLEDILANDQFFYGNQNSIKKLSHIWEDLLSLPFSFKAPENILRYYIENVCNFKYEEFKPNSLPHRFDERLPLSAALSALESDSILLNASDKEIIYNCCRLSFAYEALHLLVTKGAEKFEEYISSPPRIFGRNLDLPKAVIFYKNKIMGTSTSCSIKEDEAFNSFEVKYIPGLADKIFE